MEKYKLFQTTNQIRIDQMSTPGLLTQTVHNFKTKLSQEKDPAFPERSKPVSAPACSHLASQLCFFWVLQMEDLPFYINFIAILMGKRW